MAPPKKPPKPPVRLALHTFPDDPSVVLPSKLVHVSGKRTRNAFEWATHEYYVVVANDEDGNSVPVDKDLRLMYEIFDTQDTTTDEPIHSSSTSRTWNRKFFWFNAVNFIEDGKVCVAYPRCPCRSYLE